MINRKNEYTITDLEQKLQRTEEALRVAEESLIELGHYGIDFGYGKYECNVAKIAQDAKKQIDEILKND